MVWLKSAVVVCVWSGKEKYATNYIQSRVCIPSAPKRPGLVAVISLITATCAPWSISCGVQWSVSRWMVSFTFPSTCPRGNETIPRLCLCCRMNLNDQKNNGKTWCNIDCEVDWGTFGFVCLSFPLFHPNFPEFPSRKKNFIMIVDLCREISKLLYFTLSSGKLNDVKLLSSDRLGAASQSFAFSAISSRKKIGKKFC